MEKRLILAIAFSMFIMIGFQYFFVKPAPQRMPGPTPAASEPAAQPAPSTPVGISTKEEQEFELETDNYLITFSNIGGAIKKIQLKQHREAEIGAPLDLTELKDPAEYIGALIDTKGILPPTDTRYQLEKGAQGITYSADLDNVKVIKEYNFGKSNNTIELNIIIKNKKGAQYTVSADLVGAAGLIEKEDQDKRFVEVTALINEKRIGFKHPKGKKIENLGPVAWTALKNKYFAIILKPLCPTKGQFYTDGNGGSFVAGVETGDVIVPANSRIEQKFVLYVGPSRAQELKKAGHDFESFLNFGFFDFIAKGMLSIMEFFYSIVHSWGVSIILLAVILNLLLFPLSMQGFNSMKKMQELQPQIEKLKQQCKNNTEKFNKEVLGLYQRNKVNPLSGCLPLLLQMPIFIALYQALVRSVDLRGAKFLWISDLSTPDKVNIHINLPFLGNNIHILPIIMLIGMVIQQKISSGASAAMTEEQKQQQKIMLIIMPVMFGFIFYNMPSGLVLYWVVNTTLTITEQAFIFKKP